MNKKELVKFLIKNFTNANGNLDLSQLDFSDFDGNISISRMKVKGNLYQDLQKVKGNLYQREQKVEGNLISDLVNVQEFIKEYTFDELNEFIKELQIANNVRGSEND